MFKQIPLLVILLFTLVNLGCYKKENNLDSFSSSKMEFMSYKNCPNNNEGCLENFPEVISPFVFEDKSKTALIIGKYFCLSKNYKLKNIKEMAKEELTKQNIDLGILNSYEVLLAANKIANLLDKNCSLNIIDNEDIEKIFKNQFKIK